MIPVFDFAKVIEFAKTFVLFLAIWKAFKFLMISLTTILVPWAIYKAYMFTGQQAMEFISIQLANSPYKDTVVQLTGLGAWMGERLQFRTCFQILVTFISMRFVIGFFHKG